MTSQVDAPALRDAFGIQREIALVTGGGTGLGLRIAKCLAAAGATVVSLADVRLNLSKRCPRERHCTWLE